MGRTRRLKEHMSIEAIDAQIKKTAGFWRVRRWMIIRQAVSSNATAQELADSHGLKKQTVLHLLSAYHQHGINGVETGGKGQRQKAYLSLEEEREFLDPFIKKSELGYISTVKEIHEALEKQLEHSIHVGTIYRLLKRHDWRKISPRPSHVKSDKHAQASFKKTSKQASRK